MKNFKLNTMMNMKTLKSAFLLSLNMAMFLIILSGHNCVPVHDHPVPSAIEVKSNEIRDKTFILGSVTVDGVNKTSDFTGIKFVFNTYNSTDQSINLTIIDGGKILPVTSLWKLELKNDVVEINMTSPSGFDLKITKTSTEGTSVTIELVRDNTDYGPGRGTGIKGKYVFELVKQ